MDIASLLLRAVQDEEKMSLNAHPIIRWISIHLGKKIQVGVDKQFSRKMTKTFPPKKDESLKKETSFFRQRIIMDVEKKKGKGQGEFPEGIPTKFSAYNFGFFADDRFITHLEAFTNCTINNEST